MTDRDTRNSALGRPDDPMRFDVRPGMDDWETDHLAEIADARILTVKKALNRVLTDIGYDHRITNFGAWTILTELDSFDAELEQKAYAAGFSQGIEFEKARAAAEDTTL